MKKQTLLGRHVLVCSGGQTGDKCGRTKDAEDLRNISVKGWGRVSVTSNRGLDDELRDKVQNAEQDNGAVDDLARQCKLALSLPCHHVDHDRQEENVDHAAGCSAVSAQNRDQFTKKRSVPHRVT